MKVTVRKKSGNDRIPVAISTEFIKLEAALKFCNALPSGGMAKTVIQDGEVQVNGEICTMRGKKLYPGDTFSFENISYQICGNES